MVRTTHSHKSVRRHDSLDNEYGLEKDRYFTAGCPGTTAVKDLVYISGPGVGGLFQTATADPRNLSTMPVIGIVYQKLNAGSKCVVMRAGQMNGFTGLEPNAVYFVGLDGKPSKDPPTALPGGRAGVQIVGRALGTTVMLIGISDTMFKLRG